MRAFEWKKKKKLLLKSKTFSVRHTFLELKLYRKHVAVVVSLMHQSFVFCVTLKARQLKCKP